MHFATLFLTLLALAPGAVEQSPGDVKTSPAQASSLAAAPGIDAGFHLLYELKFKEARDQFAAWNNIYPDDPLGHVSIAAAYLFEEFYQQGVLTSEFFSNDKRLLGGIEGKPDPKRKAAFNEANEQARQLAKKRLKINRRDADALFALTVAAGMHADYSTILEKHQLEGLRFIKESESLAKQLIVLRPDEADAYLALGAANYIIGCLPSGKRFVLWFGGIHGDKNVGMQQLRTASEKGHYLRPYAKIMLALADLREKNEIEARKLLEELTREFPENHLFAKELAKVNQRPAQSTTSQ
jgi:hypothetical protein